MTKQTQRVLDWRKKNPELYKAQQQRYYNRRNKRNNIALEQFKLKHPCKCGETDPAALDFHHRDPKTKTPRSKHWASRKFETIEKELLSCEIMCANCHRKGHAGRPQPFHQHLFPSTDTQVEAIPQT